jgi:hypothetical protein
MGIRIRNFSIVVDIFIITVFLFFTPIPESEVFWEQDASHDGFQLWEPGANGLRGDYVGEARTAPWFFSKNVPRG